MQPVFGAVGGGGAVMVGMETPQDGEGGLCSLKMGCEIMGGGLGGLCSLYLGMCGVVGLAVTPQDGEGAFYSLKMGCEIMGGGSLQAVFGAVWGGGAVMVGMETLQDGEGGLCSPQLVLYMESGSEVGGL